MAHAPTMVLVGQVSHTMPTISAAFTPSMNKYQGVKYRTMRPKEVARADRRDAPPPIGVRPETQATCYQHRSRGDGKDNSYRLLVTEQPRAVGIERRLLVRRLRQEPDRQVHQTVGDQECDEEETPHRCHPLYGYRLLTDCRRGRGVPGHLTIVSTPRASSHTTRRRTWATHPSSRYHGATISARFIPSSSSMSRASQTPTQSGWKSGRRTPQIGPVRLDQMVS